MNATHFRVLRLNHLRLLVSWLTQDRLVDTHQVPRVLRGSPNCLASIDGDPTLDSVEFAPHSFQTVLTQIESFIILRKMGLLESYVMHFAS